MATNASPGTEGTFRQGYFSVRDLGIVIFFANLLTR
jgi:hypothetical protein